MSSPRMVRTVLCIAFATNLCVAIPIAAETWEQPRSAPATRQVVGLIEAVSRADRPSPVKRKERYLTVNNTAADETDRDTQNTSTIVDIGDGALAVAFNDSGSGSSGSHQFTGYAYSSDNGISWIDGGALPATTARDFGSPALAHDSANGIVYISTLSSLGVQVFRSSDKGQTWEEPVNATPGAPLTETSTARITVDNYPGMGRGDVYLCWTRAAEPGSYTSVMLSRSAAGAVRFAPTGGMLISRGGHGCSVVIGPDHQVNVFYSRRSGRAGLDDDHKLYLRRSFDRGSTFQPEILVADLATGSGVGELELNGGARANSLAQTAVNPKATRRFLYAAYADRSERRAGAQGTDIYLTWSADGGQTWRAPARVNDDAAGDQFLPAIALSTSGEQIMLSYHSRSQDPADLMFHRRGRLGVIKSDGSPTFYPSFQLGPNTPLALNQDPTIKRGHIGDYDQIAGAKDAFSVVWSDNRFGNALHENQPDIQFARVRAEPTSSDLRISAGESKLRIGAGQSRVVTIKASASVQVATDVFLSIPRVHGLSTRVVGADGDCIAIRGFIGCSLRWIAAGKAKSVRLALTTTGPGIRTLELLGSTSSRDVHTLDNTVQIAVVSESDEPRSSEGQEVAHIHDGPASPETRAVLASAVDEMASSAPQAFSPVADTYVDGSQPSVSFGASTRILAKVSSPARHGYIKFDTTGLVGPVGSAKLRLTLLPNGTTFPDAGSFVVRQFKSNAWSEATTWNTRPPSGSVSIVLGRSQLPIRATQILEIDVSGYLREQRALGIPVVSFTVRSEQDNNSGVIIGSRESTTPPQLVIAPPDPLPTGFQDEVVWSGLEFPTAVRFGPNGQVFVAEKSGIIKAFDGPHDSTATILADFRTEVNDFGDRGLNGLTVDPQFPTNPYLYAFYAVDAPPGQAPPVYNDVCPTTNDCPAYARLVRLTIAGDTVTGRKILRDGWCQVPSHHSAGDLAFDDEGYLYVSHGDGGSANYVDYGQLNNSGAACGDPANEGGALHAQDLRTPGDPLTYAGSIIRIDPATGNAAPSNPLVGTGTTDDDPIIAYGFRNPFRLTLDGSDGGRLWVGDVGWHDWEEVDTVPSPATGLVRNFGWPCYEGVPQQSGYQAANLPVCQALYAAGTAQTPYYAYPRQTGTSAITGIAVYRGSNFPAGYQGALFFADYAQGWVKAMMPGATGRPDPSSISDFIPSGAAVVDLQVGPDGFLYYVDIISETVHRVRYFSDNVPPTARITTDRTWGALPLTVKFDGVTSSDPDPGDALSFAWDLDGDGAFDDSSATAPSFTYTSRANVVVSLRVTDGSGAANVATVTIDAGNTPPQASIVAPGTTTQFSVGDQLSFEGTATDPESGTLPASAFTWQIILHHCAVGNPSDCHEHFEQTITGVRSGAFIAPDHEFPMHLELRLTVTDGSLSTMVSRDLQPRTTTWSFTSVPSGLELTVYGTPARTPFSRTVIVGAQSTISAPTPQTLNGVQYDFVSWSDGGAQTHTISSSEPRSFEAVFGVNAPSSVISPSADTYVDQTQPGVAQGWKTRLIAKTGGAATRHAYIKFDTGSFTGPVGSAKLRLVLLANGTTFPQTGSFVVRRFNTNAWTEATTWNTRPPENALGAQLASGTLPVMQTQTMVIDVTSYVNARRTAGSPVVSFTIRSLNTNNSAVLVGSRESANSAQLVLTSPSS